MTKYALALALLSTLFATALFAQAIPDPDPELERKTFVVPEGFEVTLWAGDPQMHKPIQMNFDDKGRLWVASSEVYPQIKPGEPATDKILVLEDTDDDGKADKSTVFADGLLIPTGVVPGDGGCYVANSTELLHFKDTDGDGKADQKRVVLSGFGTEDTHHLLHTLRWGHDGQLYMNQSIYIHSHVETPWGVRRLNGGGIWRFRPETLELDVLAEGFVNPWGHQQDYWGQSFATDGAYGEGINYVFPGSVFVAAPGAKRRVEGLNPGSPKHCGLEILSGRHLPDDDWQKSMITCDFRAHRVCRFVVTEDGSGYASRQEVEVIKSTHPAFRPIDVKMGSDGAIYVADWYNPIIQHGEVDFRDPRRDHVHGRIWRVAAKGRPTTTEIDYAKASNTELLDALKLPEEWIRLWAKLELKRRGKSVVREMHAWLADLDKTDKQYEHHRLEALWVHQNLNSPNETLLHEVLESPDYHARAAAVRVASQWQAKIANPLAIYRTAVGDAHPRVRLEAVRALAKLPSTESAKYALTALDKPMDKFLDFALWQAMRDLQSQWLPAVTAGTESFDGNVVHLTFALKAVESPGVVKPLLALIQQNKIDAHRAGEVLELIAALGGPNELGQVLDLVVKTGSTMPEETKASLLTALVNTAHVRKKNPAGDLNRVASVLDSKSPALQAAAARAVGAWKLEGQREKLSAWISDEKTDDSVRAAAIDSLGMLGGEASEAALATIAASQRSSVEVKARAVSALATLDVVGSAAAAAELLADLPAGHDPEPVLKILLSQKEGPAALAKAMESSKLNADTAKLTLRVARASLMPPQELIDAITKAGGLTDGGWKLTDQLLKELVSEAQTTGNAAHGELVFRKASNQCFKCHAIGGAGGVVGPDLVSIGASAPVDYLVESLIEPNKKIKENYHSQSVVTDEGKVVTGIVVRETGEELVLRDADDKIVTIAKSSIEERKDGRSLMPDGAVDVLTRKELVDLVRFLSELGKVGGDYAIGKERVARRFESLIPSTESYTGLARISFDTVATVDPTVQWEPAYSRVSGQVIPTDLPQFELKKWGAESEGPTKVSFLRTQLEVTSPGKVKIGLGDATGLMLWIDGKPTPPAKEISLDLASGKHSLVVAINATQRQAPLRLELLEDGATAKAQWVGGK
jgi:putative heme-binding domain-containing protein